MSIAIATCAQSIRCDRPQGPAGLRVLPLLGPSHEQPPYRLLEGEVLEKVRVTEVSEGGSVNELRVVNPLDCRVFLMDGQELY